MHSKTESTNTIKDCKLISLSKIGGRNGYISAIHNQKDIPFSIQRVFYLYDIPFGESRGAHAHKECHQFLIACSGSFEIKLDDGLSMKTIFLNRPDVGLHIPPGIWASELNFSNGSICLVLASQEFREEDYIRDYLEFTKFKNKNDSSNSNC